MEQDERKDLDDILSGVDELERSFEDYLTEKTKCIPLSEMRPTNVVDAEAHFSKEPNSATAETSNTSDTSSANAAESDNHVAPLMTDERGVKLTLHKHPIAGSYVTETTEAYSVDEEWQKVFAETHQIAVVDMTAEQIIQRYHTLDRTVFLIRAQQNGLRVGLEEVLKAETWQERNRLLEMDRKYKVRLSKKAVETSRSEARSNRGKPSSKTGKSKGAKTADTLHSMMMDQGAIERLLQQQGLLDEATQAYVKKLFA
jgi:hypothetical protein